MKIIKGKWENVIYDAQQKQKLLFPSFIVVLVSLLFPVDQRVVFSDSNSYYQFSFEECDSASCEFRSNEGEWPEAVRLLLQLAPYVQFRSGGGANSP